VRYIIFLAFMCCITSCSSTYNNYDHGTRMQEDSITWEYDKTSLQIPSTMNSNNNILDSQDGSVYKGNPIGVTIKY